MIKRKFSPQLIAGIFVAIFFSVALYFRIVFPYNNIFVGDWIRFAGTDAWYHMRIIDNLVYNFPHINPVDPYLLYPEPMVLGPERFFNYLFAVIIWIIGLGSPSQHTVDIISVYLPAILGALTVIPVYFIGKALINRWVGVIAAGLIALSPGEFLGRSIIGQTDHHVFEVLFSTTGMLFIILALQDAGHKQLTLFHLQNRDWSVITKPLICSVCAGVALGIYLNAWIGALLFICIFFAYLVIQFIVNYFKGLSSDDICFVGFIVFLSTLLVTFLLPHTKSQLIALFIALVTTVVLWVVLRVMLKKGISGAYYLLVIVSSGLAALAFLYIIDIQFFNYMISSFEVLNPTGARLATIEESQRILFPDGEFSLAVVWLNFTTGSFLSLISLGILVYFVVKKGEADNIFFVLWCLSILAITLSMRRFAYYFAVNVAILTAYAAWLILKFFGFNEKVTHYVVEAQEKIKKNTLKKLRRKETQAKANSFVMVLGIIIVFFLVLFPNIIIARDTASFPQFAPDDAWSESLDWLRANTPEPFGKPDFYYARYDQPFSQPSGAYGVAAHWDYGYWIARFSRRPPFSNPGIFGSRELMSRYFLAQDEPSAISNMGATIPKYIIVDYDIAMPLKKYYSWLSYAGMKQTQHYDVYVQRSGGKANRVLLYYPEYYRSLVVRLYNFDGGQVVFQESIVISYETRVTNDGGAYKEITSWQSFPSYDKALAYLDSMSKQKPGNYRIVGTDPFISPIPMNSLKNYKLAYSSNSSVMVPNTGRVPEVKIFEYLPSIVDNQKSVK